MGFKYLYNPQSLDSDSTERVFSLAGCIEFLGEAAQDFREPYNPLASELESDSGAITSVLGSVESNVIGSGEPALYLLSGSTKQQGENVSRPIVINQYLNGVLEQVGAGQSRASDGGFIIGLYTTSANNLVATSWQPFGIVFEALKPVKVGEVVRPSVANGFVYHALNSGSLGAVEPNWPTQPDEQFTSGSVTLQAVTYFQPVAHAPLSAEKNYASGAFPAEVRQAESCPVFDPDSFELSAEVRAMFA